ncbi:MAG: hypothetical protein C5B55_13675 [Blastocatellia bacterium]|nr:MAG: hypothetical protein C5B55_13675 [Blastocatellia bacterium]
MPKKELKKSEDLVVVGSSAGGVGALSVLVSTLPTTFPAPIVLAQHLDPQRQSNLASILERKGPLPVVVANENDPTPLENGKIFVVPANRHVMIVDGHIRLEAETDGRPRPSVDKLLSSAAESYGEHLIAVILTGSGSDGAVGAVEVKNAGGVVIIQNPQTAQYPSMPLSLPPTAVDYVVEIENIGPLLYDLLRGAELVPDEKVADPLRDLLEVVSRQSNVDFRNYKTSTILRRISRRMAVTHTATLGEYENYLKAHSEEVAELVKAFLIKVTGFFRDPEAFEFIRGSVLPDLVDSARANGRVLRLWSAGCATGEEAYTLALLLADQLGPEFSEWNIKIFATDLNEDAIAFARRGLYPPNVLKDLPDDYRDRYFEPIDHGYRISKLLRQTVIFGNQDLSRGVPFPRINLVLCRNLLIYLKPELQQSVLDLFAYSLHESHGYLFLGKAETARPTNATFELMNKKWKIYRCISGPLALPPQHEAGTLRLPTYRGATKRNQEAETIAAIKDLSAAEIEVAQLRRINEGLLRCVTSGVVIIDRSYRILTINAAARRLLSIRDLAYDQDFLHTVRGLPYSEVRGLIDTAFREHTTATVNELEIDQILAGQSKYVSMSVMIMAVESGAPELAIINITDISDHVQTKHRLEAVQHEQAQLVSELSSTNKRFGDMNKELQDANEELQAANEELMLTQEELQATNEEFEATNEELQATNEELETNNEELQATNEELQTTNDELTARTNELQELAKKVEDNQEHLAELVQSFPYYIMLVSAPELKIETINPAYRMSLEGREVVGASLNDAFTGSDRDGFVGLIRDAIANDRILTTPPMQAYLMSSKESDEKDFVHTVVPVHDQKNNHVNAVLIYTEPMNGK